MRNKKKLPVRIVTVYVILAFFCMLYSSLMDATTQPISYGKRVQININDGWLFSENEPGKTNTNWQKINLPHTWNRVDVLDDIPGYYQGACWYKKTIQVPASFKNKDVFLYFEGANQQTSVYINGVNAGNHIGGYTGFYIPAGKMLKYDTANGLLVKIDNFHNLNVPPLEADFAFYGGIYRDVSLLVLNPVHFSCNDFGSSGLYISLPAVSAENATIQIRSLVTNADILLQKKLAINCNITDAEGKIVGTTTIGNNNKKTAVDILYSLSCNVKNPQLWSPENPYLYTVSVQIKNVVTGEVYDGLTAPLGIKWVSADAEKGFLLNGHPYKLIGVCRHQDFEGLGNAVPHAVAVHDIELLKQMGGNFLRVAHYPQDQVLLQACYRLGILASVEIPLVSEISETDSFYNNSLFMQNEMIRQYYNHPSIVIWCHMNEIMIRPHHTGDKEKQTAYYANIVRLAKRLDSNAHALDKQRLTMIANDGNFEKYTQTGLALVGDIVGWNLYKGWYNGALEDFPAYLDQHHAQLPGRPVMITEYGADADFRINNTHPQRFDKSIEYAVRFHQFYLAAIKARPYVIGGAIWNLADFISEQRQETMPHYNIKGLLTIDRTPKPLYYFYKSAIKKNPLIKILQMATQVRGGVEDSTTGISTQLIQVAVNTSYAELICNAASLGRKKVINGLAEWLVPFKNGENVLEATGSNDNILCKDMATINFVMQPKFFNHSKIPFSHINILLGATRYFTDQYTHELWLPDEPYQKGSWGHIGGTAYKMKNNNRLPYGTDKNILETTSDPVYQTQQTGIEKYRLDVPNGSYEITLHFAFLEGGASHGLIYNLSADTITGKPVGSAFNVFVNGELVLENFNIEQQYGAAVPVSKKIKVVVENNGGIEIEFAALKGLPVLNALQVQKLL